MPGHFSKSLTIYCIRDSFFGKSLAILNKISMGSLVRWSLKSQATLTYSISARVRLKIFAIRLYYSLLPELLTSFKKFNNILKSSMFSFFSTYSNVLSMV